MPPPSGAIASRYADQTAGLFDALALPDRPDPPCPGGGRLLPMINHILVGVDGSPASRHAAHQGLAMAEQLKAKVTLLFVLETPPVLPVGPLSGYVVTAPPRTPRDLEAARRELAELVAERPGVPCERRVEVGVHAAEALCDFASHQGVDLLVVGARGRNAGARWLLGSTSDRVVHHAPCPVMVVRDHAAQG